MDGSGFARRLHRTGGVIEALDRAKQQGKVRYVGFTGHKDPRIHKKMIDLGYAWDAVQFPINAFDAQFRSFQQVVKRGSANEVLGYAGKMIAEHEGLMKEMQALERVLGAERPERLAPPDMLALRHLESVTAVDFDQEYALRQIGDHLAACLRVTLCITFR